MAVQATITAANSVLMLVVPGLFPVPQQLQGYAADDVFTVDSTAPVEVLMGVDGFLSGGWVPTEKRMSISLQADSLSNAIFEAWQAAQQAVRDAYTADMFVTLPAISRIYTCTRGFLTGYPPTADVRRVLQPRRYQITWNEIIAAPV